MITEIRETVSTNLIRFATDRSIERGTIERDLYRPDRQAPSAALAALEYARLWGSVVLWVGWRLQPRDRIWS